LSDFLPHEPDNDAAGDGIVDHVAEPVDPVVEDSKVAGEKKADDAAKTANSAAARAWLEASGDAALAGTVAVGETVKVVMPFFNMPFEVTDVGWHVNLIREGDEENGQWWWQFREL
jgi:hypothetical protein